MDDESAQSKEVDNADDAKADVNSRDNVASPNLPDNISDSTLTNQGYKPIEKAEFIPDVESIASSNVNCIVQGNCSSKTNSNQFIIILDERGLQ